MSKVLYLFFLMSLTINIQCSYLKLLTSFFLDTGIDKLIDNDNINQFIEIINETEDELTFY